MPDSSRETRDPRIRGFVLPARVVWHTEGAAAPENLDGLLDEAGPPTVWRHRGAPPAAVLDFGRVLHGGIRLQGASPATPSPVRVRVRLGETVAEVLESAGAAFERGADLLMPGEGTVEFGETGFRFARIELLDEGSEFSLSRASGVHSRFAVDRRGAFRCSDDRLTRIWDIAADTVHACMQDVLWHGLKRDRFPALAVQYPAFAAAMAVFGADAIVPRTLDSAQAAIEGDSAQDEDSRSALWWVVSQAAWYGFAGDESYLAQQRTPLLEVLNKACASVGPDGRLLAGERALDASSGGAHAEYHGLTALALRAGAELCHALGETEVQVECQAALNLLCLHSPEPTASKPANALLALAGLVDVKEINSQILGVKATHGFSLDAGYTVLQARALAGDFAGALDLICAYWGGMLDLGATSFWDYFDLDWAHTAGRIDEYPVSGKTVIRTRPSEVERPIEFCASASAGPAAWLTEHVLGLKPAAPGCDAVMVNPNLAGLDWAEGALPTPHGLVRVRAERTDDGRTKVDLDAPRSVRIVRR